MEASYETESWETADKYVGMVIAGQIVAAADRYEGYTDHRDHVVGFRDVGAGFLLLYAALAAFFWNADEFLSKNCG